MHRACRRTSLSRLRQPDNSHGTTNVSSHLDGAVTCGVTGDGSSNGDDPGSILPTAAVARTLAAISWLGHRCCRNLSTFARRPGGALLSELTGKRSRGSPTKPPAELLGRGASIGRRQLGRRGELVGRCGTRGVGPRRFVGGASECSGPCALQLRRVTRTGGVQWDALTWWFPLPSI